MFAAALATIACLLASGGSQPAAAQGYTVPTPTISVLSPSGIRFKIAEPNAGLSLIAYHYSINVALLETRPGQWNYDVTSPDGHFVHENELVTVNNGDTVYYWVYAVYNGLGYHLLNRQWTYRASTPALSPTSPSATTVAAPSTLFLGDSITATASTASTPSLGIAGTSLPPTSPSATTVAAPSTQSLGNKSTVIVSTASTPSLSTAGTWSKIVDPVSATTPTAGVPAGFSTTDAIILGVVLGVAVVLAAILSVILVLRSRRNSLRPPSGNSNPPVDKPPEALPEEASPARPLSEDQSDLYECLDEEYSRGSFRGRSPDESAWPDNAPPLRTQALTEPYAGSQPPLPLSPDAGPASTIP